MTRVAFLIALLSAGGLLATVTANADSRQPETRAGWCCKALGGRWDPSRKIWGSCPIKRLEACLGGAKNCPRECTEK